MEDERENLPAIADDFLIQVADQAERRVDAVMKIKRVALKVTNARDWTDQNGNPYLQVSGSEKIANLFNISWRIDEPLYEEEANGHFTWTYKGYFTLGGRSIEAIGTRSSKDAFFNKYEYVKVEGKADERKILPPSAIDKGDVKKAALTNLFGNGITRILGIRNLTWDDLKEFAGILQDQVQGVQYKKGGNKPPVGMPKEKGAPSENPDAISDAQVKRFYAIAKGSGASDEQVKEWLFSNYALTSTKLIPKSKYDEICTKVALLCKTEREPGSEG